MRDFGADKLVKAVIVGKPEVVSQNEQFATMMVKIGTSPNLDNWKTLRGDLLRVLNSKKQAAGNRISVTTVDHEYRDGAGFYGMDWPGEAVQRMQTVQGAEYGYWIAVLQGYQEGTEPGVMKTQWISYRFEKSVSPIFAELCKRRYRMHVMIIGKTKNLIAEDDCTLKYGYPVLDVASLFATRSEFSKYDAYFLAPFLWGSEGRYYAPAISPKEFRINVPINDLPEVSQVTAKIEQVKEGKKEE